MKKILRKKILEKFKNLNYETHITHSKKIQKNLLTLNHFEKAKKIGLYFSKDNEVSTKKIITNLLQNGKEVFLPKIENNNLNFKKINKLSNLEIRNFGILEPKEFCPNIPPTELDLLIIPCIAIDEKGNRIGRGGGFYDRFISKNKIKQAICLAYEFQIFSNIIPEKHDQKIDYIITEKRIIQTKQNNSKLLDGKTLANQLCLKLKDQILKEKIKATLAVILVGNHPASELYVNKKQEKCQEIGLDFSLIRFPKNTTTQKIIHSIEKLNNNKNITGILVQLPLPKQIDGYASINSISPQKDVDGLTFYSQQELEKKNETFACCTPKGIIELLNKNNINLKNKKIVLVGHGKLVGKPLSQMLKNRNLNFTVCNSKTKNIKPLIKQADILISATGVPHIIKKENIKKGTIVIDAGTAKLNNKIVGDVDFEKVKVKASKITPVPGGVGPMTIAMLMQNIIEAYKLQNKT